MVSPFVKNPLGGNLGARTASFFRLDPTGTVPVEPLLDLFPALGPNRVTLDIIDSEDIERTYLVTTNALQDFTAAQSNIHKDLDRMTLTGTLISSIDLALVGSVGLGGIPGFGGGLRADLLKIENLENLADRREPVMVLTPRKNFPKAFIESIARSWSPDVGDNTLVTITVIEARIVNPLLADAVIQDVAASYTGNNSVTSAGAQSGAAVETQSVTQSTTAGVSPTVITGPVPAA
jgi:hypothetical protein